MAVKRRDEIERKARAIVGEERRERRNARRRIKTYNPRNTDSKNLQDIFWFRCSSSHHLSRRNEKSHD